jgi:hypothetical protein
VDAGFDFLGMTGVRAITLTLFYLSFFGKTTAEAAKHLRRSSVLWSGAAERQR